jgi:hypothetical protein
MTVIHLNGNDKEAAVTLTLQLILLCGWRFYEACVINFISIIYVFLSFQVVKYFALSSTNSTVI